MANIVVSSNSNFDAVANQALDNGDDITIDSAAVLTINSDVRWAQNAAVIGRITMSAVTGGELHIDGRDTWWLAFDTSVGRHHLDMTGAVADDGGVQVNQTAASNDDVVNDMTLLPAVPVVGDAYYFGYSGAPWTSLWVNIGTQGAGNWTITWEYFNGGGWVALSNVTDGTTGFKATVGWKEVRFSIPADWALTAVQGINAYWIRGRVSAFAAVVTQPRGTRSKIGVLGLTLTGAAGAIGEIIGLFDTAGAATISPSSSSATGWFKLRSKTGAYVNNEALTINGVAYNGALVDSATGGVRGWIHIVGQETEYISVSRAGTLRITGDWFDLGTTNGIRGQTLQGPVMDYLPGIWVETGVGTGLYEFWPNAGSAWTAADMSLDSRCRFVEVTSAGLVRIGQTAAAVNVADLPPAGCNVRIPNVIISSSTAANWATNTLNATLGSRWEIDSSANGIINLDKFCSSGFYVNCTQAYAVTINNSAVLHAIVLTEVITNVIMDNVNIGLVSTTDVTNPMNFTDGSGSITVSNCKFCRYGGVAYTAYNNVVYIAYISDVVLNNISAYFLKLRASALQVCFYIIKGTNVALTDCDGFGGGVYIAGASETITVTNYQHCDVLIGSTSAAYNTTGVVVLNSKSVLVNNVFWPTGITNVHPYLVLVSTTACTKVRIRNIGTAAIPLDLGAANACGFLVNDTTGYANDTKVQRCYCINSRTNTTTFTNSDYVLIAENVWGDAADTIPNLSSDSLFRGCYGGNNGLGTVGLRTTLTSIYGSHFYDAFHSAIRGKIGILFTEKTTEEPSASSYSITAGSAYFDATGKVYLRTSGDTVIYTWPYYILGYTGFTLDSPQISGTNVVGGVWGYGNHRVEYCIDKNDGTGYGVWQELTAINLNAEAAISATLGFKLKIRISAIATDVKNAINSLYVLGTTDAVSQIETYPLVETVPLTLDGIVIGSTYRIEETATGNLIVQGIATSSPEVVSYDMDALIPSIATTVKVRKASAAPNYIPFETYGVLTLEDGLYIYVSQALDTNNP